jgi:AcrR family transcriptional regulator
MMLHLLLAEIRMPYRRTENVVRRLAARRDAILAAAGEIAAADGMCAVQVAPVAERAGIATGTVYRYFPSKTELVAALVAALAEREMTALGEAAKSAPGPLSALAAAIVTFAARALARRRLAFALIAEPVEPEIDRARAAYRQKLTGAFARLIQRALEAGRLPEQDAALAAPALLGAVAEGLIGEHAPATPADPAEARARVQMLTLFALRALGVNDARARGLVVQTVMPEPRGHS